MKEHYFKRTLLTKQTKTGVLTIFKCDKCLSEVAFDGKLSDADVNRAVMIRWPKFACAPELLKN